MCHNSSACHAYVLWADLSHSHEKVMWADLCVSHFKMQPMETGTKIVLKRKHVLWDSVFPTTVLLQ